MNDELKSLQDKAEKQRAICNHDQVVYLRPCGAQGNWALFNKTGNQLSGIFYCVCLADAEIQARAWASSWSGIMIEVEDISKKTQKVLDESMKNLANGKVGEPIDLKENDDD